MRRSIAITTCVASSIALALLSGCAQMKATKAITAQNIKATQDLSKNLNSRQDDWVSFSDQPYLGSRNVSAKHQTPKVLLQKIMLLSQNESLSDVIDDLSTLSGVNIVLSQNAMDFLSGNTKGSSSGSNDTALKLFTKQRLSPDYKNISLQEALNRLTKSTNLFWKYDENTGRVFIFRTTTQVFHVMLPVSTFSNVAKISSASSNKEISGSDTNVGFDTRSIDAWKMLETGIRSISKDITVSAMKSRGVVIVHATPDELAQVGEYIDAVNKTSKNGVMIKAYVYNIKVDKSSNYGINWDAIYKSTHGSLSWNTTNLSSAGGASSVAQVASATAKALSGPWSGSNLVVNALQNVTDATRITGGSFFSANGVPTPISNVERVTYVKQVNVTTLGGSKSSSDNVQKSVEPGTLQVGYVFVITPLVISHDRVSISLSVDMSKIESMVKYNTGSGKDESSIQLPTVSHKKVIQLIPSLENGQTAVITGFGDANSGVGTNSIGGKSSWWAGGNQGTSRGLTKTVLVVTPYILGSSDEN